MAPSNLQTYDMSNLFFIFAEPKWTFLYGMPATEVKKALYVSIPFSLKSGKLKLKEGRYRTRPSCVPSTLDGAVVTVPFL